MKKNSNFFPWLSLAAGTLCLILQACLHLFFRDERGLIPRLHPLHLLTLAILLAVILFAGLDIYRQDGHNCYKENFPASTLGGITSFLLAGAIGLTLLKRMLNPHAEVASALSTLWMVLGLGSIPCLCFTGLCRIRGQRPAFWLHTVLCLYLALELVTLCQIWNRESQPDVYVPSLLAIISWMLNTYHHTAFEAGIGRRRMLLLTGILSGCLCLAALPAVPDKLLFLAGSTWALTNLCQWESPKRRRRQGPTPQEDPQEHENDISQ